VAKEIEEKLHIKREKLIFVSDKDDHSIEDLFTHDDLNNYILDDLINVDEKTLNSRFIKDSKIDKVLLAKKFFDKIKTDRSEINLSTITLDAFQNLFNKIFEAFDKT
jgi:hypothetical protein